MMKPGRSMNKAAFCGMVSDGHNEKDLLILNYQFI